MRSLISSDSHLSLKPNSTEDNVPLDRTVQEINCPEECVKFLDLVVLPLKTQLTFLTLTLVSCSPHSRNWMQPFLLQPPNVPSQQSRQRNPLWHLHHACVCACVCIQCLMKRDSLRWGAFCEPPGLSGTVGGQLVCVCVFDHHA